MYNFRYRAVYYLYMLLAPPTIVLLIGGLGQAIILVGGVVMGIIMCEGLLLLFDNSDPSDS